MLRIKENAKKIVFIYFGIMIGVIFIISLLFIFNHIQALKDEQKAAVFILDKEALEIAYKNRIFDLSSADFKSYSELKNEIYQSMVTKELLFIISLCISVCVVSLFFYHILKKQRINELHEFVRIICSTTYESFSVADALIKKSYRRLEQHFEENLKSYKKLSSYLSHEQKNAIFLLRAKLEYDGHNEYLKQLDDMATSMDDILTISDIEDEKALEKTDCLLICAELCDRYQKAGHSVRFYFCDDDCYISAKPRWIERAIGNLLDNAVKYSNGLIVELSIYRQYDNVIITVSDQGPGITKEDQKKIFQNRYRVKELNKDGYGIGLSLVMHVCELCGSFVWVDSEPNQGSVFYLSFPILEDL
jgi:Signal transduction histidine kinase